MTEEKEILQVTSPVKSVTDDAVGMPWFVALVRHNTEKKLFELLSSKGLDVYIPVQSRLRVSPSGRKKWVEKVVLPSKLFLRCSEKQRLEVVSHPFIYRFMMNPSAPLVNGVRQLALIPDKEIQTLRFMLNQSDYPVDFVETEFSLNDSVRVIRGSLKGLEGKIIESPCPNKDLVVYLDLLGSARILIPSSDIEKI